MNARSLKWLFVAAVLMPAIAVSPPAGSQSGEPEPAEDAPAEEPGSEEAPSLSRHEGLTAWARIYEVFSHPRCANCHVGEAGVPMWSGPHYGTTRPHGMNINAGESRIGAEYVLCSACHGLTNSPLLHGPPGAAAWLLPPAEFEWFGKASHEICMQVRDPERNGQRSIEDIAEHVGHDAILRWAWDPGPGRETPPLSLAETMALILAWGDAGAPCPNG